MVSRVTFTDNRAPFGSAAASLFSTANGSTFDDIMVVDNPTTVGNALYFNIVDSITIMNSTFEGGTAEMESGMIYATNMVGLNVHDCTFEDITIDFDGGAIETRNALQIDIRRCDFTTMAATGYGGAIYLFNATDYLGDRAIDAMEAVIDSCTFDDNSSAARGGAVSIINLSNTVSNSTFNDCLAAVGGGLYYVSGTADTLEYLHRLMNNTFSQNIAGTVGGGICYLVDQVDFEIMGNTFTSNVDGGPFGGGAIYLQGEAFYNMDALVEGNEFTSNTAQDGIGAAARLRGVNTTVRDNTFSGNMGTAGTLGLDGEGMTHRVVSSSFLDNGTTTAPFNQGAGISIFSFGTLEPINVTVDSCTFQGNVAAGEQGFLSGGSGIYMEAIADSVTNINVLNSNFTQNSVTDAGGTIMLTENFKLVVDNCDFFANTGATGAAINLNRFVVRDSLGDPVEPNQYDSLITPTAEIRQSLFVNNIASSQGGAINSFSVSVDMRNSMLIGNAVANGQGSGGALIINGGTSLYSILDNYLINNTFYNNRDGGRPEVVVDSIPGSVGNAVAIYQPGNTDPDTNAVSLTIQNNAFFMDAVDEESIGLEKNVGFTEDPTGFGEINLISLGGNFFNSTSDVAAEFTDDEDDIVDVAVDLENIFIDPFEIDRESEYPNLGLVGDASTNPLIDAGTSGPLVPEVDLFGNERVRHARYRRPRTRQRTIPPA